MSEVPLYSAIALLSPFLNLLLNPAQSASPEPCTLNLGTEQEKEAYINALSDAAVAYTQSQ